MSEQQLLCPFLDDSLAFARGVEFGMFFTQMRRAKVIADYFLRENQDQILLAASRLGWTVVRMKREGDWIWIKMKPPARAGAGG